MKLRDLGHIFERNIEAIMSWITLVYNQKTLIHHAHYKIECITYSSDVECINKVQSNLWMRLLRCSVQKHLFI